MDAVSLSRASTSDAISALLAGSPFASSIARGSALVIASGSPLTVVYATPSVLSLFGARDLATLTETLFDADSPGARRLRALAQTLRVGATPRLESLRFYRGRLAIPVGWLCARIVGEDGEKLLLTGAQPRPIEGSENIEPPAPTPPAPEPEVARFTPMPLDGPVRFLWSADDEGRFGPSDAALAARLGGNAPSPGETLDALRARVALASAERWAEAIAARRTFSGLRLEWPEPGATRARVVLLSGAPIWDRRRAFAGFRGFGIFTGEGVALTRAEPNARAKPKAPLPEQAPNSLLEPDVIAVMAALASPLRKFVTSKPPAPRPSRTIAPAPPSREAAPILDGSEREATADQPSAVETADVPAAVAGEHGDVVARAPPTPEANPASEDGDPALDGSLASVASGREDVSDLAEGEAPAGGTDLLASKAEKPTLDEDLAVVEASFDDAGAAASPSEAELNNHHAADEPPHVASVISRDLEAPEDAGADAPSLAVEPDSPFSEPVQPELDEDRGSPSVAKDGEGLTQLARQQDEAADASALAISEPEALIRPSDEADSRGDQDDDQLGLDGGLAAGEPLVDSEMARDADEGGEPAETPASASPASLDIDLIGAEEPRDISALLDVQSPEPRGDQPTELADLDSDQPSSDIDRLAADSPVDATTVEEAPAPLEVDSGESIATSENQADEKDVSTPAAAAPDPPVDNTPPSLPRIGRDFGAEIFLLRPANAPASGAPNVVPFRPGALGVPLPPESSEPRGRQGDSVELSSRERDAFREIARTLGARGRAPRSEPEGGEPPPIEPPVETAADVAAPPSDRDVAMLVDHLPIGALVTRAGEAVFINRTLLELLGHASIEEFRAAGGLDSVFRGRDPAALLGEGDDLPLVAADGELMNVHAHARTIVWEGEPSVLIALRRSRSLEHQAEIRSVERESRARDATARDLAAALDLASDGMIRLDQAGRILAMNPRAEALLGYDQKEAAGESFLMLFAPSSHPEATTALEAVTREFAAPGTLELTARERGGGAIPVRVDFGRFGGPEPEFFLLLRDLTKAKAVEREREAAREAAEKASARKTDFLARVSHEIRTPLHAILGFAEVMMEERFGPIGNERYKDYIKDIHASGRHVMSLANDLLDLSKIEAGKMELQFAPVDANRIIRECVALMQPQAARERIIMRLSLLDKLPNVMADERSLRQIMLNLMSNAVKFNEPGGQVIISTALDESGHAIIRVRDTGLGMSENELGVALEPFRRVPGGEREGTGLGLPLTKALAEANHADFSIKSRKEQGTLVEVAFPSARAAQ